MADPAVQLPRDRHILELTAKRRQNLIAFHGIGVAAAMVGIIHPVFAMVSSEPAVLANSFAGQLLSGEHRDRLLARRRREQGVDRCWIH